MCEMKRVKIKLGTRWQERLTTAYYILPYRCLQLQNRNADVTKKKTFVLHYQMLQFYYQLAYLVVYSNAIKRKEARVVQMA